MHQVILHVIGYAVLQGRKSTSQPRPASFFRDRAGSFEPELVKKGQTRIDGVDDKIIGLYAAGLSVRDIQAHLEDLYGLRVSADLISRVTDAVLDEVREWQHRALDRMYPIVIFDALRIEDPRR